jgi:glycosyltransferase involved in cell wall biosynthesis
MPLRTLAGLDNVPPFPEVRSGTEKGTLTVAVTCYEMGSMIKEATKSVWASERLPDEVLLVDDGSCGEETVAAIEELENEATERNRPLRVIRQPNRGLAGARNAGLAAAKGEFISLSRWR